MWEWSAKASLAEALPCSVVAPSKTAFCPLHRSLLTGLRTQCPGTAFPSASGTAASEATEMYVWRRRTLFPWILPWTDFFGFGFFFYFDFLFVVCVVGWFWDTLDVLELAMCIMLALNGNRSTPWVLGLRTWALPDISGWLHYKWMLATPLLVKNIPVLYNWQGTGGLFLKRAEKQLTSFLN